MWLTSGTRHKWRIVEVGVAGHARLLQMPECCKCFTEGNTKGKVWYFRGQVGRSQWSLTSNIIREKGPRKTSGLGRRDKWWHHTLRYINNCTWLHSYQRKPWVSGKLSHSWHGRGHSWQMYIYGVTQTSSMSF